MPTGDLPYFLNPVPVSSPVDHPKNQRYAEKRGKFATALWPKLPCPIQKSGRANGIAMQPSFHGVPAAPILGLVMVPKLEKSVNLGSPVYSPCLATGGSHAPYQRWWSKSHVAKEEIWFKLQSARAVAERLETFVAP